MTTDISKCLIDLKWACTLLVEMQRFPCRLTNQSIDALLGKNLPVLNGVRKKFTEVIECEEKALASEGIAPCTLMMEKIWDSKKFWFFYAP
jgi:hypothetical protein